MSHRLVALLGVSLLFAAATPALAQETAESSSPLALVAENHTAALEADDGRPRGSLAVIAGDIVRYTLRFTNPSADSITNVVLTNPLPEGMQYLEATTETRGLRARIEYSADGGATYARARPGRDGRPPRYTHVRWTINGWLQPGQTFAAHYDVRMNAPPRAVIADDESQR